MWPLPSSQRCTSPQMRDGSLGPAQPAVREDSHQGEVEACSAQRPARTVSNAAATLATGLDGGEADDSEHVGGEGAAGLALGLG